MRAFAAALLVLSLLAHETAALAARPQPRRPGRGARARAPTPSRKTGRTGKPHGTPSSFFANFGLRNSPPPPPAPPRLSLTTATAAVKERAQSFVAEVRPLQILSGFALAVVLTAGSVVSAGQALSGYLAEDDNGAVLERTLKFGTILENVKAAYVDQNIDIDALFQTGVNSMLSTLDPYSTYENAQQADDLALRTTGKYGGVGLTIGKDADENILVLGALEGFAFDAGVRPGDRIVAIDGASVSAMSTDKVKDLLRGEPGTSIQLTVQRDGAPEPTLSMAVQRKLVRLPDVTLATLDGNGVGYMKLEGFSEGTAEETARAIKTMQERASRQFGPGGLKALVLDMRDNPGGLLDAAVSVSQMLVPEGTEIVSTAGRVYGEGTSISYRSTRPPLLDPRTRLVVLVNSNTASAAEIVTGVVQDTDRGVVVGERTYGKGLVQIVEPLPGGGSLKLTVAKYYTPSGRCIQAVSYAGGRLEASASPKAAADAAGGVAIEGVGGDGSAGGADSSSGSTSTSSTSKSGSTSSTSRSTGGGAAAKGRPLNGRPVSSKPPAPPAASEAGAVQRIDPSDPSKPSSTTGEDVTQYVTAHGRAVKGGGGVAPDVVIAARQLGTLERALLQRGYFFDFSGEWLKRHAAPTDVIAAKIESGAAVQEEAYREFIAYVREKVAKDEALLEPTGLSRQLDALEKSIENSGELARKGKAVKDLANLRRTLQEEQLDEFRTDKERLRQDLKEALLGRLTAPSARLASQLATDPQVSEAGRIASDAQLYQRLLLPEPSSPPLKPTTAEPIEIFPTM